jgi:hypothetical protein
LKRIGRGSSYDKRREFENRHRGDLPEVHVPTILKDQVTAFDTDSDIPTLEGG